MVHRHWDIRKLEFQLMAECVMVPIHKQNWRQGECDADHFLVLINHNKKIQNNNEVKGYRSKAFDIQNSKRIILWTNVRRSLANEQCKHSGRFRLQDNLLDIARKCTVMKAGNGQKGYSAEVYK